MDYHTLSTTAPVNYRSSGYILAGLTVGVYLLLALKGRQHPALLVLAAAIALSAWRAVAPLRWLVDGLIAVGNLLHRFTNPVMFGLIFLVGVVPTALVMRLLGKDPLGLRPSPAAASYWVARHGGRPWQDSFRNQF
jgi:hypothetical protein